MKIQRIFIYPVKSLRPVEVTTAEITNEGLRFDRIFLLAKPPTKSSNGLAEHITIKSYFTLGLFHTAIDKFWSKLTITRADVSEYKSITLPLTPSPLGLLDRPVYTLSIFGTKAPGIDMGDAAADFFAYHLGFDVRLLYIGGNGQRDIPGAAYVPKQYRALSISVNDKLQPQRIRFADAAPLLITTSASEESARRRLPQAGRSADIIVRFRPNVHIDVGEEVKPFDEDYWSMLRIKSCLDSAQEVSARCLFRTVRCLSLNADLEKGGMIGPEQQLYGLLMKDRRVNEQFPHRPVFGQYACAGPSGAILRVGDEVIVTERVAETTLPSSPSVPTDTQPSTKTSPVPSLTSDDEHALDLEKAVKEELNENGKFPTKTEPDHTDRSTPDIVRVVGGKVENEGDSGTDSELEPRTNLKP